MTIKILLLGSGGREHALATALKKDPFTADLFCAPANPGSKVGEIDDSVKGTKAFKIKLRKQLIKEGLVIVRKGPNNSDLYFAV